MKHLYILALLLGFSLSNVMAQKIEVGSCTLKDGGIYTGELKSGKPSGKGRVQYENGDTYEGSFEKVCVKVRAPLPLLMDHDILAAG